MSNTRRPLIVGNWKMNGLRAEAASLAGALAEKMKEQGATTFDMLLCPPATIIDAVGKAIAESGLSLGGQDCHANQTGAHTGDISASMLADLNCGYGIVGHSERRTDHDESDAVVKAKAEAALAAGLVAIVCVGETEEQRDAGNTMGVVAGQIAGSLPESASASNLVVAYEPVWAIGTGRTPDSAEVQEVHAIIRQKISELIGESDAAQVRLLYGGSVKPRNANELMSLADVDGALVGGACLNPDDFWAIAQSCP